MRHNAPNNRDDDTKKILNLNHLDQDFKQAFHPSQMRCLALVSHNEMKATMKKFVLANKTILKKFRLTGTNSTMTMLQEVFKGDDSVIFGPSCSSGPLGGDAELVALMCAGQLGGVIFFQDPMSSHPHQSDIDCLCRQAVVHNTMIASNPTSALMMMTTLRCALKENMPELIPSFFCTLQSPSVSAYMKQQNNVIASHSIITPNLQGQGQGAAAGDRDEEPSAAHHVSNGVPAPTGGSASTLSLIELEKLAGAAPHSFSDTTSRSMSYDTLATMVSSSARHDDDDDSESVNLNLSKASHLRRLDAQTKLVQSFALFVESVGEQSTTPHSPPA
jgi:methylglyoxal synthase